MFVVLTNTYVDMSYSKIGGLVFKESPRSWSCQKMPSRDVFYFYFNKIFLINLEDGESKLKHPESNKYTVIIQLHCIAKNFESRINI